MNQPRPPTTTCPDPQRRVAPCVLVIFGASGDLAGRKLLPALCRLFDAGILPENCAVLGLGRTGMDDEGFRGHLAAFGLDGLAGWDRLAPRLSYLALDYDDPEGYQGLAQRLADLRGQVGNNNRLFYLATPPHLAPAIATRLGEAGLSREEADGWARVVVEKPFGTSLASATALDQVLHRAFGEHQIFRIDHYLAKETVQNILMFRFANTIFEPVWNRNAVAYVGILAGESLGVEHRAGYYETAGVIRDMFQNHMMQLLALTAMEPPATFTADRVQDEKVKVFQSLQRQVFTDGGPDTNLVLGQYTAGRVDGREVVAYREEPGVAPDSLTPTFAAMRLYIDNWRWRGVPFYLVSGKRLAAKMTRIVVQFRNVPHSMFQEVLGEREPPGNRLLLGIHPREEIRLTFQAKRPGPRLCLQPVAMDFAYGDDWRGDDAYVRVLVDCIQGDHMLFWRQDGVRETWRFLDPILQGCESCPGQARRLHFYPAGGWGPEPSLPWVEAIRGD